MIKNRINVLIIILSLLLCTSCGNNLINDDITDQKSGFENNVQDILNIMDNYDNISIPSYINIVIDNNNKNNIMNFFDIDIDISKYNINSGIIAKKENQIYLSLENEKFCAIKDFEESNFSIYDISEREKCHKFNTIDDQVSLNISAYTLDDNEKYVFNSISNDYIILNIIDNVIDHYGIKYQWYRNDKEINNSNMQSYIISSDFEDANYSVEITTLDGNKYTSESVNVKISK